MNQLIYQTNIEKEVVNNEFYRKVLFSTNHQQLVIMALKPNEDIPLEVHPSHDQFFCIEKGQCTIYIGENQQAKYDLTDGDVFIVPANTWHRVCNPSNTESLKLYTIYSPPEHPANHIEQTKPMTGGKCACNSMVGGKCACNSFRSRYKAFKNKYLHTKN